MCGRFTLTTKQNILQIAFPWVDFPEKNILNPRYNIAPSQPIAVVPNVEPFHLDFFLWGLVPSWAKDPKIGTRLINARAETLAEKPSFKNAFKRRRCLVFADGFYEWQSTPHSKTKTPYYIHLKNHQPFAIAGIWEIWQSPDGSEIRSCSLITTQASENLKHIHSRMPVIIPENAYHTWLTPKEQPTHSLQEILKPYSRPDIIAFPVSNLVNNPTIDNSDCIKPRTQ